MDALEERDGRSDFRQRQCNRILRQRGGWAAQGLSAVRMGVISWADQRCAGKGSGSLSRNLARAQPEGCRAVLLISGGQRRSNLPCLGLDRHTRTTSSPCGLAGSHGDGARHRSSPALLLAQHNDSHGSLHPTGIGNAGTAAAATLRAVAHFLPDVLPFFAPLKRPPTDWADLGGAL